MTTTLLQRVKGVSGILLKVTDLPRSRKFYAETLEFPIEFEQGEIAIFRVGDVLVELLADPKPDDSRQAIEEPGMPKLADPAAKSSAVYSLGTDDCDGAYEHLTAKGVVFLGPPHDRHWGERTCYFTDPDGYAWELTQRIPHAAWE